MNAADPLLYSALRQMHVGCAVASIALFGIRAACASANLPWRQSRVLRVLPHVNDTLLLLAAIGLASWSNQTPWTHDWLGAKVLALLVYIGVGRLALQERQSLAARRGWAVLALLTVGYIVLAARTRSPLPAWLQA